MSDCLEKQQTLNMIKNIIKTNFSSELLISLKTKKGNTQKVERTYIKIISDCFDKNNITYEAASSQQSIDFRNINNTGLNLEIKKTDSNKVKFNDTCPNENVEYCILYTGSNKYKSQILFINGKVISQNSPWIEEYIKEIEQIKIKYCVGKKKKNLEDIMTAYVRPNLSANISSFLE